MSVGNLKKNHARKNLQPERLVFFSDAVVAIAITLLALDIKIGHNVNGHLSFADITAQWKSSVKPS